MYLHSSNILKKLNTKKLLKFLSLSLALISLLLPSASALKPIDESVLEEMIKDPTVINAYAEEVHREYKQCLSQRENLMN